MAVRASRRGAPSGRGPEAGGPGGTELLVVEVAVGIQEGGGFRGQGVLVVFEKTGQDVAVQEAEKAGIGEEAKGHRSSWVLVRF